MTDTYIGLMSGTSFDGIDAVMVSFENQQVHLHNHISQPFSDTIRQQLLTISRADQMHALHDLYRLDAQLGLLYVEAIQALLAKARTKPENIRAIGCHGQTIRHFPDESPGFSVQIGDPNIIVSNTGITTISDFRRRDIAQGGQGAPLAPAFHARFLHSPQENRAILNIGGFANITYLPKNGDCKGFDTGPGNCLMDAFAHKHLNEAYDNEGQWARSGTIQKTLLAKLLQHPFFAEQPPKSTGRDDFHMSWLNHVLEQGETFAPEDIQATLTELTAMTIADAIHAHCPDTQALYVCGGGAFNTYLAERLQHHLNGIAFHTTEDLGLPPQLLEATLMAWLAEQTLARKPIDLRKITGSEKPAILGAVYYAN